MHSSIPACFQGQSSAGGVCPQRIIGMNYNIVCYFILLFNYNIITSLIKRKSSAMLSRIVIALLIYLGNCMNQHDDTKRLV